MTRRGEIAKLLPVIIGTERSGEPVHLSDIYAALERGYPTLVDQEIEPSTGAVRWKHELRWELETLVLRGEIRRRKDLGRAVYSK